MKAIALASLYENENAMLFEKAMASVSMQSVQLPIALVIDGPITKNLENIINAYAQHIKYIFRLEANLGLGQALQIAVEKLQNDFDFVIRFDTDDVNLPERFEKIMSVLETEEFDLVGSHLIEQNEKPPFDIIGYRKVPISEQGILKSMHKRNPFNHPTVAFRISTVLKAGGYRHMPYFEDWFLWARMVKVGARCRNIDENLVKFTGGDGALSRRRGFKYACHEVAFFVALYRVSLPKRWFVFVVLPVRVLSRLLGSNVLKFIYNKLLR